MLFRPVLIRFTVLALASAEVGSYIFPFLVSNCSVSQVTTEVGSRPLDTAYITAPNSTSYEWWYFDAVASDLSASIVLQPVVQNGSFVLVLDFSLANGANSQFQLPYEKGYFSTDGDGGNMIASSGEWQFTSSSDLSQGAFDLNIPLVGVTSTVKLQSVRLEQTP